MDPDISIKEVETEECTFKHPPCMTFNCSDDCCRYGVDVEIEEYHNLISNRLAVPKDFTGPEKDENGYLLYRTKLGPRGCIFLRPDRGCSLHNSGCKPAVCKVFPRDYEEAKEAYKDGYLPCVAEELDSKAGDRTKKDPDR